ncbi:MAG: hypothetical protein KAR20_29925, partial [Candidatus Heimdallarchaeota archaeon]|nr:hypothetical protein [Candidatus Heimdallarchaeota archaeon]
KPKTKRIRNTTHYLYDCYLIELILDKNNFPYPLYLFASPFKKMLKDIVDSDVIKLKSEKASFHYLNIPLLIERLKSTDENPGIFVTRVNLQTTGADGLKSITLYGDDVVFSKQYDDISRFSKPSSIRLVYRKLGDEGFAVNTDRGGNWSFYLKDQSELICFEYMLCYFEVNGLIDKTYTDPRKRRSTQDEKLEID